MIKSFSIFAEPEKPILWKSCKNLSKKLSQYLLPATENLHAVIVAEKHTLFHVSMIDMH